MTIGTHVPPSKKTGNLFVAYSDETGASVGIEFSSTTQERATADLDPPSPNSFCILS